ncbi:hypothetical protein FNV43_RR09452 [Rhamnella rubrinervis]|uniref:Uncharacterized protein n=1 Tax=Rhamnella rubrinervis TaxID=2594499 RepID=A0A8K0HBA6_9ROSA|nr:hypothetical protein FNV43_RR09452 [Rhamnella rubrinervis]
MESMTSTSSVSGPHEASHRDEIFMQQSILFSESLNELKNLRKQLYSAAEYFESSYSKEDSKQIMVETLKDYTMKALVSTVDHLGSMAYKVNHCLDEKIDQVSTVELRFHCIQQRLQTCQDFIDRGGVSQKCLALSILKHHKRYSLPVGATMDVVDQSICQGVEEDLYQSNNAWKTSPAMVSVEYSSSYSPLGTFQFARTGSRQEKHVLSQHLFPLIRGGSLVQRSATTNLSTSKRWYPTEPQRSVSMCVHGEGYRSKDTQRYSGKNKRLFKALISMRKSRKEVT